MKQADIERMEDNHSPQLVFAPDNETDDYTMATAFINEEYARIYEEEKGHGYKESSVVVKKSDGKSLNLDSDNLNLDSKSLNLDGKDKFFIYRKKMQESGVSQKLIQDVSIIYDAVNEGECFKRADLAEILQCSPAKAAYLMNAMKTSEVIEKIKGFGNGRYRFINYPDMER